LPFLDKTRRSRSVILNAFLRISMTWKNLRTIVSLRLRIFAWAFKGHI
jgi:hypothetical protein